MANITIYLRADLIESKNHLHLRDSEGDQGEDNITTEVQPGDNVIWTLDNNSGIRAITNIYQKPGSQNLFSSGPNKISDTEWSGTIKNEATGEESYSIDYTLTDGTPLTDDPQVRIPPPGPEGN